MGGNQSQRTGRGDRGGGLTGVFGSGRCLRREAGENYGIPTAPIATAEYAPHIKNELRAAGLNLPFISLPTLW